MARIYCYFTFVSGKAMEINYEYICFFGNLADYGRGHDWNFCRNLAYDFGYGSFEQVHKITFVQMEM